MVATFIPWNIIIGLEIRLVKLIIAKNTSDRVDTLPLATRSRNLGLGFGDSIYDQQVTIFVIEPST